MQSTSSIKMIENNMELLLKYPLISTEICGNRRRYVGRVMCGNRDLDVDITETYEKNEINFKLNTVFGSDIDAKIAAIKASNITGYLDELTLLVQKYNDKNLKNCADRYRRIIQEYSEFTTFHFSVKKSHISRDLSYINITTVDEGGREHLLEVTIDFDQAKNIFQPKNPDLPLVLMKDLSNKYSSLSELYSKFSSTVDNLQCFFNLMDNIDTACHIMDPEQPTRRDCYRRIWLGQNLSLMITVDPLNVKARPVFKFLGPERVIDVYLQKLSLTLDEWSEETDLLQALLDILDLEVFPSKCMKSPQILIDQGECSICFTSRLHDKLPEIICSNKSCENFYHVSCLFEWLTSVNSKRIFNQLHGHCPNCEKGISCPLPEVSGM